MFEIDEEYEACVWEAYLDGLEHYWAEMHYEMDPGPAWSAEELAEIAESIRRDDYLDQWGELDPLSAGFKPARREGA